MKIKSCVIAITLAVSPLTYAASAPGIPVGDVMGATQRIEMIGQGVKVVKNGVDQLLELQRLYTSMTGPRALSTIFNALGDQSARRWIPEEYSDLADLASQATGVYADISRVINDTVRLMRVLPPDFFPAGSDARREIERQWNILATQKATGDRAYRQVTTSVKRIEDLIQAAGTANDLQATAAVQARLIAEQAFMQAETNRTLALMYNSQNEELIREQQSRERLASRNAQIQAPSNLSTTPWIP
jgi:type IV secretion system protein VirB5